MPLNINLFSAMFKASGLTLEELSELTFHHKNQCNYWVYQATKGSKRQPPESLKTYLALLLEQQHKEAHRLVDGLRASWEINPSAKLAIYMPTYAGEFPTVSAHQQAYVNGLAMLSRAELNMCMVEFHDGKAAADAA